MFIILRENEGKVSIIHTCYSQSEAVVFIEKTLNTEMESFRNCPIKKNIKKVEYFSNKHNNKWTLVERSIIVKKGYFYNTKKTVVKDMFSIFFTETDIPSDLVTSKSVSDRVFLKPCRLYNYDYDYGYGGGFGQRTFNTFFQ